MGDNIFRRAKSFIGRVIIKILIIIAVFIITFFLLYGIKRALGIDIFEHRSLWDILETLFS
jgi:hypothetical protein